MSLDAFLGFQGLIKPYGSMETWETNLIPIIALLSDATAGQGHLVSKLVIDAIKARGGTMIIQLRDVVKVGRELYEG